MILAAHQPGYLPWLGYFHKIASADVFVLSDQLQFSDDFFQHRNRLKIASGATWLTVPIVKGPLEERICDKRIHNGGDGPEPARWQRQAWNTIRMNYGRAPWFTRYAADLEEVYQRRWERLIDVDLHLTRLMMRWLEIDTPLVLGSSLGIGGRKSDLILDMCLRLGATEYVSGRGASLEYLDVELLARHGVQVRWQEFHHPVYPQRHPDLGFISHLAALDLILNCGPDSRGILFDTHSAVVATAAMGDGD